MHRETEFLAHIVREIVNNEGEISIERIEDELGVLLTLSVAKKDMGIIIGKSWNTIQSLRSILRLFWAKIDKKINLKVLD